MNNLNSFRWDDGLEGAAKRIAEIDHTPLRVLAGPGTGKTFALMRRITRLLQNGTPPNRILVCTFTRTAARDLQTELSRLGVDGVNSVHAGTLHSLSFGLLSRADVLELTGRVPRPLLSFEERFLFEDLNDNNLGTIRDHKRRLQAFNAAWARLQSEEPGWPNDPIDQKFQTTLLKWLLFHKAILIGELIPETLRYLRDNPASQDRKAFDHILVDEYQDLNKAEQVLLDILSDQGTLTVIGDEDQSIYSFKHAHPEGISTFEQNHPRTHDEDLEVCRRCPMLVVNIANALITNNSSRVSRTLHPMEGNPPGDVYVIQWQSIEEEAQGIAKFIRERVQNRNLEPGKVLVLAPRRQFGYAIRDAINNLGINAHSFFHEETLDGNPKMLDESVPQQAFTLLTLLANPEDIVALRCWCGFGSNSLRRSAWKRVEQHCVETGDSPWTTLEQMASGVLSFPYTSELVTRFKELQLRLTTLKVLTGKSLIDTLFPHNENWTEPFRNISASIESDNFGAEELREILRIGITQPELPTDVDYVRVMSLHKSKGLTADLVVVVGCIEGLVPFVDNTRTPNEQERLLEEQRRLFYVAITRTRNILVLSSVTELPRDLAHRIGARVGRGDETHAYTISSRFFSELGPSRPEVVLGSSII